MKDHQETISSNIIGNMARSAYEKAKAKDNTPLSLPLDSTGQPLDESHYEEIFREETAYLLGPDFLSKEMLLEKLNQLRKANKDLKNNFESGNTLVLGIFPTVDTGRELTDEEIHRGNYLHYLLTRQGAPTASTFCLLFGPFEQVIPARLRHLCSLPVSYGNGNQPFLLTEDLARIYDFHIEAFNHWRQFFGLEPISDVPKYGQK